MNIEYKTAVTATAQSVRIDSTGTLIKLALPRLMRSANLRKCILTASVLASAGVFLNVPKSRASFIEVLFGRTEWLKIIGRGLYEEGVGLVRCHARSTLLFIDMRIENDPEADGDVHCITAEELRQAVLEPASAKVYKVFSDLDALGQAHPFIASQLARSFAPCSDPHHPGQHEAVFDNHHAAVNMRFALNMLGISSTTNFD